MNHIDNLETWKSVDPWVGVLELVQGKVYLPPYPPSAGHLSGPSGRGLVKMTSQTRTLASFSTTACKKHVPQAQVLRGPLKDTFPCFPKGLEVLKPKSRTLQIPPPGLH